MRLKAYFTTKIGASLRRNVVRHRPTGERAEYLQAALWCAWQAGAMLARLNLRQAAQRLACILLCIIWAVTGGPVEKRAS
jgi:hypothetical protein